MQDKKQPDFDTLAARFRHPGVVAVARINAYGRIESP